MSDKEKLIHYTQKFEKLVPICFAEYTATILIENPCNFVVVNDRKTKLGTYSHPHHPKFIHQITVNGGLNPYSFLITTIHEFAHLTCYLKNQNKVKPHGQEWKNEYKRLMWPIVNSGNLPKDLEIVLVNSFVNVKASSCSDINLLRVLRNYDEKKNHFQLLEELPKNATFVLQGKKFVKGNSRRTRVECVEMSTKKNYLVHALAEVQQIEN